MVVTTALLTVVELVDSKAESKVEQLELNWVEMMVACLAEQKAAKMVELMAEMKVVNLGEKKVGH